MTVHQLVFTRRELEAIAMALRGDLSRGVYERNLYRHRKKPELEALVDHEINAIMGAISIVEHSLGPPTRLAKVPAECSSSAPQVAAKADQVSGPVDGPAGGEQSPPVSNDEKGRPITYWGGKK
jgi:hypothetical protein